jgi:hypothetical protein
MANIQKTIPRVRIGAEVRHHYHWLAYRTCCRCCPACSQRVLPGQWPTPDECRGGSEARWQATACLEPFLIEEEEEDWERERLEMGWGRGRKHRQYSHIFPRCVIATRRPPRTAPPSHFVVGSHRDMGAAYPLQKTHLATWNMYVAHSAPANQSYGARHKGIYVIVVLSTTTVHRGPARQTY